MNLATLTCLGYYPSSTSLLSLRIPNPSVVFFVLLRESGHSHLFWATTGHLPVFSLNPQSCCGFLCIIEVNLVTLTCLGYYPSSTSLLSLRIPNPVVVFFVLLRESGHSHLFGLLPVIYQSSLTLNPQSCCCFLCIIEVNPASITCLGYYPSSTSLLSL